MVTLWNPADEAQDFVFTLQFSGGRYHLPIHLEARATEMFNVSEVARNQFPNPSPPGSGRGVPYGLLWRSYATRPELLSYLQTSPTTEGAKRRTKAEN
jgi:hypothetical protein